MPRARITARSRDYGSASSASSRDGATPTLFDTLATSAQDLVDRMLRVSAFAILTALFLGVAAQGATTAVIKGTAQSDDIQGTQGGDLIYGFVGNDEIDGRGGSDVIFGGPGNDTLSGGGGKDYLAGEEGDDTLSAAYGEGRPVDFLSCGAGEDLVILADVPEVDRGGVRRLLDGAPSRCESVRFTR